MMFNHYFTKFLVSLSMHLGLIAFVFWSAHLVEPTFGVSQIKMMQAYVYQDASKSRPQQQSKKAIIKTEVHRDSVSRGTKNSYNEDQVSSVKPVNEEGFQNNAIQKRQLSQSAGKYSQLLHLLHQAIAAQQKYPEDSEQTGKVTLGFILSPQGFISNIKILKSSGSNILDDAAQQSIQAIAPFKVAVEYLTETKDFTIDIVYQ